MNLFVEAIGFAAPGLENWHAARAVLRGEATYARQDLSAYQPALLPANERRRAAPAVRLAFRVAEDAVGRSAFKPADLAMVFATSEGDTSILHRLCTALAEPQRAVSPTDFHNSVHNAAAGYWSIAAAATKPSTSLSAFDATFAAGLIEAATQVATEGEPVLLVCYDVVPPVPLHATRPIADPAGVALVLTASSAPGAGANPTSDGARVETSPVALRIARTRDAITPIADAALEALRLANPAARALPLLRLLARGESGRVVLPGAADQRWAVQVG